MVQAAGWAALFIANQTATHQQPGGMRAAAEHGGMKTQTHVCAHHIRTAIKTKWQHLKLYRHDSLRRSIRQVNTRKIVTDHICCSSGRPSPQSLGRQRQRHFIGGNARLQPAKHAKLTYSLIAFNEDNVSPECRRDLGRWRCLCTPPQNWLPHKQKPSEQLIFNSKLWIPNHLSQRLPFPQQTFPNLFN